MAEQLEFYFPKTKSKHMAMPTTGKKYPSKGGTVRFGVQASMNGSMSLPKYVKEEEFYDYGFGVDSVVRKYPQKFMDAFYDFDSNPTADTQDDETVAIAYQAWYQKQAENEVLNAEVSVGEKQITNRKDYDIDNELSGFSNMEVGDIDLEDYEDEITASVENEVIEAIRESVDDNMPISDGDSVSSNVYVDTELEITVPISGDIDYDWTANENYDENEGEWNAETGLEAITEPEVFGGSNYAVKMIKNAQNHLKMVREAESFEAPYGGIGSLFGIGGDTEIGGFSTSELTGSSAIHGDFDSASLNYSGHQNLQVRADTVGAKAEVEAVIVAGEKDGTSRELAFIEGMTDKDGFTTEVVLPVSPTKEGIEGAIKAGYYANHAETVVGNPSPSSPLEEVPATVPSPAEPTNETFNAEDYGWVLTHPKMGRSGVFTTKDDAEKVKNWYIRYAPSHYEIETSMKIVKANANDGDLDKRSKSIVESFDAEMDELSEDTSIIRNRVGDMVGMVELDENDEDIEKVDIDIIDDDGEMAYEGTLGAENNNGWEYHVYVSDLEEYVDEDGDSLIDLTKQQIVHSAFSKENAIEAANDFYKGYSDKKYDVIYVVAEDESEGYEEIVYRIQKGEVSYSAETFESQGTNTKMILGITALAVGLGLWKGKEIMSISEKITESIKNMRK